MTLIEMLEKNNDLCPSKTAIIFNHETVSYSDLYRKSIALANFLVRNGFRKGERVGLLMQKSPEAIISFLGIANAGGIVFPIDYNQPEEHIQYLIDLTRPSALIVSSSLEKIFYKIRFKNTNLQVIMVGEGRHPILWNDVVDVACLKGPTVVIEDSDPVYLNFTSGSTGMPKGAITTHENLFWNTKSVVESLGIDHEDIHLCGFPFFTHPHELFCRALYTGGTIVLTQDFLPSTVAKAVAAHKVTCLMAISLIYENLIRYEVSPEDLNSIRVAESAGMHVSSSLINKFREKFGISLTPGWGSTEASGLAFANLSGTGPREDSIGKPCPYYEVKILDESGNETGADETGEMVVRGMGVCSGYFENDTETKKTFRGDWLFTGDLVRKNAEGYYFFVARKSRMIKVAGLKVYPGEIEEVLNEHPEVIESVVVKINDQALGEVPKAVVVLSKNARVGPEELRKFCAGKLAKYKVPKTIDVVDALPKAASGKILYNKLQSL